MTYTKNITRVMVPFRAIGLRAFAAVAILCTAFLTFSAVAYEVEPLVLEMPLQPGASGSLRVVNNNAKPVTLEVTAWERTFNPDGTEGALVDAEDDFIVLPPQTVVQPGKTQVLRVQYVGEPSTGGSKHYRIKVAQLPVSYKSQDDSARTQIVLEYGVAVHMAPAGSKPDAAVTAVKAGSSPGSVVISLANPGEGYHLFRKQGVLITNAAGQTTFVSPTLLGANFLAGGAARDVEVKVKEGFAISEPMSGTFAEGE